VNTDIPPPTTTVDEDQPRLPGRPCGRTGCPNRTRFKYCCDDCRIRQYNEQRSSTPSKCGICSSPQHRTDQCTSDAAKLLPALLDVANPRRCRNCGQTNHDSRSRRCKKRNPKRAA